MSDYRDGLHLIPEHMRNSVIAWVEHGEPNPNSMGRFLRAVLRNNLCEAIDAADDTNRRAIFMWAEFLIHYMPCNAWGSIEQMSSWYQIQHLPRTPPDPILGFHVASGLRKTKPKDKP